MTLPKMYPVDSSSIGEVGYDENTREVFVKFLNGSFYIYKNVPPYEFTRLLNAASIGSYLNKKFKNVYACERIF